MYTNVRFKEKKKNFNFDLPCRTSPRRCSLGYPGGWSLISFLQNLYVNTKGRFTEIMMQLIYKLRR